MGPPRGGGELLVRGGEREWRGRYLFWMKNTYIDRRFAWLKYFTCHLLLALAPNYKQHILSPAKVTKVCYSLAELYVKSVYLNLFGRRWAQLSCNI
jgi:hypothetical protein